MKSFLVENWTIKRQMLKSASYLLNSQGSQIFISNLFEKSISRYFIGDKIWIWDRRFFECNCSGLKNKETVCSQILMQDIMLKKQESTVSYLEQGIQTHVLFK